MTSTVLISGKWKSAWGFLWSCMIRLLLFFHSPNMDTRLLNVWIKKHMNGCFPNPCYNLMFFIFTFYKQWLKKSITYLIKLCTKWFIYSFSSAIIKQITVYKTKDNFRRSVSFSCQLFFNGILLQQLGASDTSEVISIPTFSFLNSLIAISFIAICGSIFCSKVFCFISSCKDTS